jgi:hypothetical protein
VSDVLLHVLLDAGHDEAAGAVGFDTEAVTGLDSRRCSYGEWDRHLVVR